MCRWKSKVGGLRGLEARGAKNTEHNVLQKAQEKNEKWQENIIIRRPPFVFPPKGA